MSIGPAPQKEQFELSKFERIRQSVKVAAEAYFKDPLYYLFYGLLTAVSVGLLFGTKFPWQLYAILGALGVVDGYKRYQEYGICGRTKKN